MDNRNTGLLDRDDFDFSDLFTAEELAEIERAAEAQFPTAPAEPAYTEYAPQEEAEALPPQAEEEEEIPTEETEEEFSYDEPKAKKSRKERKGPGLFGIIARVLSFVLATVIIILCGALGVIYIMSKGPSESARDLFVLSLRETSAAGFVAGIFLDEEEIALIEEANKPDEILENIDTSLITIAAKTESEEGGEEVKGEEIEIFDVSGATFKGKMMVVSDPERVIVGVSNRLGAAGQLLPSMIESYGGVGGTNAGGFDDPNGTGNGGIPLGVVIHEGQLLSGANTRAATAVIDYDGILHVGNFTGNEAMDLNAEWAVSFGPVLVVNGEKCDGLSSGLNPRTAIGQRSDGAILLLVINGRQVGSMGATYEDVADVMLSYGAVNALNLDGGSSSTMLYHGEYLNISSSLVGERPLPTGIIVLDKEAE
ncbi:MAG: phosphodiester glycosidase family protein [Oscillospiraceae bacterium]|nr:phosphodiester glycosidase family protein [Oscillospiraceae bacterium]